jgi:hypothetical protein
MVIWYCSLWHRLEIALGVTNIHALQGLGGAPMRRTVRKDKNTVGYVLKEIDYMASH